MTHNHPILNKCTCEDCLEKRGQKSASVGDYATELMMTALHPPLVDIEELCAYVQVELMSYDKDGKYYPEEFDDSGQEKQKWIDTIERVRAWLGKVRGVK